MRASQTPGTLSKVLQAWEGMDTLRRACMAAFVCEGHRARTQELVAS